MKKRTVTITFVSAENTRWQDNSEFLNTLDKLATMAAKNHTEGPKPYVARVTMADEPIKETSHAKHD
jgi:hypothetical protein